MGDRQGFDASLVETIVGQVKSQGLFDTFRRECLADVDTKPAFMNLRQLVETTVSKFLSRQEWTPEMNKNQLREKMRKHIIAMNFLEAGVERIVDQVVNPKVSTVFRPNIEEMVYKHLGIELPKVEPPGLSELCLYNSPAPPPTPPPPPPPSDAPPLPATDLPSMPESAPEDVDMLPTDLEAVSSPDSNRSTSDDKTNSPGMKIKVESTEDVKPPLPTTGDDQQEGRLSMELDDEESPPFEPIAAEAKPPLPPTPPEACTIKTEESQDSNISGLTSQDSIESEAAKELNPDPIPKEEIKAETAERVPPIDSPPLPPLKEESQLSQVSSDTQNSSRFENNTSTEEPLKMDISEEAQMPSRFPVPDRNANNEVVTSFDLQKEVISFEQVKREKDEEAAAPAPSTFAEDPTPEKSTNTDSQASVTAPPEPNPTGVLTASEPQPLVTDSGNLCPSGEVNKILIKANMTEDTEESLLDSGDSMDLKIVESDSRGSVSASNQSVETAGHELKKDEPSRSSSHRRSHHHSDQHHRSSSSSASHHRSSNKSSSSKDRGHHRSRDHHKSSDRSRSRKDGDRRPRDKGRDRDNKEKERNRDREKERQKRSNGDSCKDRSIERRSTDRDSNDGANSGGQKTAGGGAGNIAEKGTTSTATGSTSGENPQKASSSPTPTKSQSKAKEGPSSPSVELGELSDRLQQPIVVDQFLDGKELNLQMRAPTPTDSSKGPRKPKIAANLKEAMKLMRVRKMMDLQRSKEEEKAAVALNRGSYGEDAEQSLHYFPDETVTSKFPESASEKWWKRVKEQDEEKELVGEVKKFLEQNAPCPPSRDDKTLKPPPTKRIKVDAPKPLNGLTTTATSDFVDMDDYQEAEVVLEDLLPASVTLTENNNVHTENKNYGMTFNKLVNGDAELELTSVPEAPTEKNRPPKAPVSQRYTSEDLYKPRPGICGRSRRSRALEGGAGGAAEAEGSR